MTPDPFDLNLRHLRGTVAIAAQRSMNGAARAVNLSQPALTQGLAKLERQLGVELFTRRADGMAATPEGERLAERAAAALGHLGAAARAVARGGGRGFTRPDQLMTAAQTRAFVALADAGSFVGAAAATGLSQPAVHRAVRDLEQVSGAALVERRGRGVGLTAAGQRLARGIRLAASEIAAGIAETRPDRGAHSGRLVIGAMPLCRALLLPAALAQLMREAPAASIDVVEGSRRELVEPLRDGVIDLMIGALRPQIATDLVQRPLFTDQLVVVGRAGHPLATGQRAGIDDLASYPWVAGRAGTPLRTLWAALFDGHPPPPAPIDCGSVMVIRGILRDSDFLTLLSPDQVAMEVETGILAIIDTPLTLPDRRIGVTTRAGWRPTPLQARFLDLLEIERATIGLQESE
jgi:DNA-binding transcriptional LysR family regulator